MHRPRVGAEIAPATSRSIVRANVGERRDQRLNERPVDRERANSRLEDHGGLAGNDVSGAVEVKAPPADVDETPRWRIGRLVALTDHRVRSGEREAQCRHNDKSRPRHFDAPYE